VFDMVVTSKPGACMFSMRIRMRFIVLGVGVLWASPCMSKSSGESVMAPDGTLARMWERTLSVQTGTMDERVSGLSIAHITTLAGWEEVCMAFPASIMVVR
jgi:hypothetical protein